MKVHVLSLILLVAPGYCWWQPLDKSGTSGSTQTTVPPQTREKKKPAIAGSFLAEREGFVRPTFRNSMKNPRLRRNSRSANG
ncbi:MAG: hypothetical protein JWO38_1062 [Gemmataceae bacterium]|nr:hypothetical protein [Gemmataceae bacterium]